MTTEEMYRTIRPGRKKFFIRLAIGVVVLGVLVAVLFFYLGKGEERKEYVTQRVSIGSVQATVSASGTINATNEVKIGSQISGTILQVLVEENDRVKKGDVLAVINPETINQSIAKFRAQLNSANANLKAAGASLSSKRWNYERMKKLYKATNGKAPSELELQNSKAEYETALAEVDVRKASIKEAETSLNSAQIDLKNSIIISPIDGIVLTKSIEAGQTVAASFSTPELFTVAENLEKMKLVVKISEADVGSVSEGQSVNFTVDAYPDKTFKSVVDRVNVGASASSDNIVSYETTIYIDNREYLLRSGMSATADIITAVAENAMLVPVSALYFKPTSNNTAQKKGMAFGPPPRRTNTQQKAQKLSKTGSLWILGSDNTPEQITVELGVSDGKNVEVLPGKLAPDMNIITGIQPH